MLNFGGVLIVSPLLNSDTFTLGVLNQNPTENRSITKNPELYVLRFRDYSYIYSFLFFSDWNPKHPSLECFRRLVVAGLCLDGSLASEAS